jgi:hypothetical protein
VQVSRDEDEDEDEEEREPILNAWFGPQGANAAYVAAQWHFRGILTAF